MGGGAGAGGGAGGSDALPHPSRTLESAMPGGGVGRPCGQVLHVMLYTRASWIRPGLADRVDGRESLGCAGPTWREYETVTPVYRVSGVGCARSCYVH